MPRQSTINSAARRVRLADFIDSFGNAMVKKCSACNKHGRICKVHVRSGKCSECVRRNQRCDVKVTESEFKRLIAQKEDLRKKIQESRDAQEGAFRVQQKAIEDLRVARAREERLRLEMDLLDRRADEVISVETRDLAEEEQQEGVTLLVPDPDPGFSLSPSTWGAWDGLPLEFWEADPSALVPVTSAG